jgi:hypothetical protein
MIKQLTDRGIRKAVISHYPRSINDFDKHPTTEVTRMSQAFFNNRGMISILSAGIVDSENEFYETPYVSGGFLLSRYTLLEDVPYDPNLDFLFTGEEICHSVRIWTSGYNIYTPYENIIYHEYIREGKPKVWENVHFSDQDSFEKVKKIIGLESTRELPNYMKYNADKYGVGNERSLQEYYEIAP